MKKILVILIVSLAFNAKATIHQIGVWGGYYQFVPNTISVELGDTIHWIPFEGLLPMMPHTITSENIPLGASNFDYLWQMPNDTFFEYIPQEVGLYEYVCSPHIEFGMIGEFTVINSANIQLSYVPDDNFEQALINLGFDNFLDNYVTTSNINSINYLDISNNNISDLTGIEDFTSLDTLRCNYNNLETLDVSNNTELIWLGCAYNQLVSIDLSNNHSLEMFGAENNALNSIDVSNNYNLRNLICYSNQLIFADVRNGNNYNAEWYMFSDNPNLFCINVDDPEYSNANWLVSFGMIDSTMSFSNNCSPIFTEEKNNIKKIIRKIGILSTTSKQLNQPIINLFDDGSLEKIIIID